MRKILLTFLTALLCSITAWGAQGVDYANGFESGTDSWTKSSMGNIGSETTNVRTGSKSLNVICNNANGYLRRQVSVHRQTTNYIHFIVWAKSSATTNAVAIIDGSSSSSTSVTTSGWTRLSYTKSITGSGTQNKNMDVKPGMASGTFYIDDAIVYYSESSTIDLAKPTQATSASANTSSISWTNGTDANTGIQNTLILRRTSGDADDLALNDQGLYAVSATDQSGHWTVVSNSVTSAATSYSGTFSAGDRYAIVHRDLAYNYSSPTYVTIVDGGASCTVSSAEAGANKSTTVNTAVALAATAAGSGKTGTWSITSKPDGSTASTSSFSDVNSATATFTPDKVGDYTLTWTVECDDDDTETASDNMTVTANCIAISPTLSYASVGGTTLDVGDSSSGSPTVSGNTGSGSVSYAVTTASPAGCLTVNTSTGVASAVAAGSATVTATIAASGNYCGNTATANFTIADDCTDPGLTITLN